MLKFSDLKVDFKSYENTLSTYMKLFPNSYMPLLIMYLSREGLLGLEEDADNDDNRVILSVSKDDITNFLKNDRPFLDLKDEDKYQEGEDLDKWLYRFYKNGYDISIFATIVKMLIIDKDSSSISLVINNRIENNDIIEVKNVIMKFEPRCSEKAAIMFFLLMIKHQTETYHQSNTDDILVEGYGASQWVFGFDDVLDKI